MGAGSNRSSSSRSSDLAIDIAEPFAGEDDVSAQAGDSSSSSDERQRGFGGMWGRPKVIMWLGSSIGNCDREQADEFLQQVRQKAMNKGRSLIQPSWCQGMFPS